MSPIKPKSGGEEFQVPGLPSEASAKGGSKFQTPHAAAPRSSLAAQFSGNGPAGAPSTPHSAFRTPHSAEPVGEVLKRWIKQTGVARLSERERLWAAWERLLGPDAPHTTLSGMRDHVVTFTVDSSPLLSELANFRKQELLECLREEVKSYFVRDIRFRLEKKA